MGDFSYLDNLDYGLSYGYEEPESTSNDRDYVQKDRWFVTDILHRLYKGSGEALDLAGRGLEPFGGGETLKSAGKAITESEFAKPDIPERAGTEGLLKRVVGGVAEALPSSMAPVAMGIGTTALTGGNVFAGGAVGLATMTEMFGGGTYSREYESAIKQGKNEEEANEIGLYKGALAVGTEFLGDAATALTFGTVNVGTVKALQAGLKSGAFTSKEVIEQVAGKAGGKYVMAKLVGAPVTEGATEVVNEIGSAYVDSAYDLAPKDVNYLDTFLIGFTMSGPISAVGAIRSESAKAKTRESLEAGLNSESPDIVRGTAAKIYDHIKKADPDVAESWSQYVNDQIRLGSSVDINKSFSGIEEAVEAIKDSRAFDLQTDESKQYVYESNQRNGEKASDILGGKTPDEVLSEAISINESKEPTSLLEKNKNEILAPIIGLSDEVVGDIVTSFGEIVQNPTDLISVLKSSDVKAKELIVNQLLDIQTKSSLFESSLSLRTRRALKVEIDEKIKLLNEELPSVVESVRSEGVVSPEGVVSTEGIVSPITTEDTKSIVDGIVSISNPKPTENVVAPAKTEDPIITKLPTNLAERAGARETQKAEDTKSIVDGIISISNPKPTGNVVAPVAPIESSNKAYDNEIGFIRDMNESEPTIYKRVPTQKEYENYSSSLKTKVSAEDGLSILSKMDDNLFSEFADPIDNVEEVEQTENPSDIEDESLTYSDEQLSSVIYEVETRTENGVETNRNISCREKLDEIDGDTSIYERLLDCVRSK